MDDATDRHSIPLSSSERDGARNAAWAAWNATYRGMRDEGVAKDRALAYADLTRIAVKNALGAGSPRPDPERLATALRMIHSGPRPWPGFDGGGTAEQLADAILAALPPDRP